MCDGSMRRFWIGIELVPEPDCRADGTSADQGDGGN